MIRYRYVDHFQPPAPFISVSLRDPLTGRAVGNQAALIDTAADRTILPALTIETLGVGEDGHSSFQGFAGNIVELPLFLVEIRIHDLPPFEVRAALGKHEPYILLGRDVLNALRIVLDGPQHFLELSP